MTGSEFLTYVKRVLKRTDKDTEIYEATTDIVNDIRLQLKTEDYKKESAALSISSLYQYKINLPSDFKHLIGDVTMVDNTGTVIRVLRKISKQTYDSRYGDRYYTSTSNINTDVPSFFCIFANQIFLAPVPDSTAYQYRINYSTEDYADITAATDPVPFAEKFRTMLRSGVLAEVYAGMESFDESNYWRQLYMEGLMKLKNSEDKNIDDKESVVYHGI